MKNTKYNLLFVLVLLQFAFFSSCDFFYNHLIKESPQKVSDSIDLGPEWIELYPPNPLISKASIQYISLKMSEQIWRQADWDPQDATLQTLLYENGNRGKIQAILFDDKGQSYELQIIAKGDGFDLGQKITKRTFNEPPKTAPDFPFERTYVKLRIRSDVLLHIDRIEWSGYNPK